MARLAKKDQNEREVYKTALGELRRKYDEITHSYDQLRVKVLALIAGEIALVTFLFNSIEFPKILYGMIFFIAGVVSLSASFIILIICTRGVMWKMPNNQDESNRLIDEDVAELKYLKSIKKGYDEAIDTDLPKLNSRGMLFDRALILMLIGVIILIVIKYGKVVILP